jgi:L-rhamnose-H+ transport protein
MEILISIVLISLGGASAASFYVPIKKVRDWSWETYWIVQGVVAWIIGPWVLALCTVPGVWDVLRSSPPEAVWNTFMFGALWGVGGLTFGLSMRFLGVGLGQSIALGFTAALGTLIPPFVAGENLFTSRTGILMLLGVAICVAGIALVGYAGTLRSQHMVEEDRKRAIKDFALRKGILIAVVSGIMSACMNYGINGLPGFLDAGNVIQKVAAAHSTDPMFVTNPVYIPLMFGGFVTNFLYTMYLNWKNKSFKEYVSLPRDLLLSNVAFSALGGTLWFLQYFFLGIGQSKLPGTMLAFAWSILMASSILFSNIWGLLLHEWKGTGRKTMTVLVVGLILLVLSCFVIKL